MALISVVRLGHMAAVYIGCDIRDTAVPLKRDSQCFLLIFIFN